MLGLGQSRPCVEMEMMPPQVEKVHDIAWILRAQHYHDISLACYGTK